MTYAEMFIAIDGYNEFVNSARYVAFEIARFNAAFTAFGSKQLTGIKKYKNPFRAKGKREQKKPLTMGQVKGRLGGLRDVKKTS